MAESADATDLKSVDGDIVRVRPPLAPQNIPTIIQVTNIYNYPQSFNGDYSPALRKKRSGACLSPQKYEYVGVISN